MHEDRRTLSTVKCTAGTLVSGNINFVWIFASVLRRVASNDSGIIEKKSFFSASLYNINIGILRDMAKIVIRRLCRRVSYETSRTIGIISTRTQLSFTNESFFALKPAVTTAYRTLGVRHILLSSRYCKVYFF